MIPVSVTWRDAWRESGLRSKAEIEAGGFNPAIAKASGIYAGEPNARTCGGFGYGGLSRYSR